MALDFEGNVILHSLAVKFVEAFLPEAKKPYYAKPVHRPVLDIHAIASMGEQYNITTPPKIIEEGLTAGLKLIEYLTCDGYMPKLPTFSIKVRVPGEYNGTETHLPDGIHPQLRIQPSAEFTK